MRNVNYRHQNWFFNAKNKLQGIRTGGDLCTEHELGIGPIKEAFGLNPEIEGLDRFRIQSVPAGLQWVETARRSGFIYLPSSYKEPSNVAKFYEKYDAPGQPTIAWTDDSFMILAHNHDPIKMQGVRDLWRAFQEKDVYLGGSFSDRFKGGGMGFFIGSRMPRKEVKQANAQIQKEVLLKKRLEETAQKEGFDKTLLRLREAGRKWICLRPKILNEDGSVGYWLNPMDQNNNYFGLVSIGDLNDWVIGKGRIPGGGRKQRGW